MEGMIDDIDSTLYEKFQTIFDAVRDEEDTETEGGEEEFRFDTLQEEYQFENGQPFYDNMNFTTENKGSTVTITSNEEDEAFKDLEKALKNWKHTAP